MRAAGVDHTAIGGDDPVILELTRNAELDRQIAGPDQQRIDAGHRGDSRGILDCFRRFEHDHNESRGVNCGSGVGGADRGIAEMRQPAGDRAVAARRIAEMIGDLARLLGGVDMRHDDAEPAAVENAGGEPVLSCGDPRDRSDPGAQRGDRDLHRGIEIHRIVFEVEEQPVIAAGLHDRSDVDRAALTKADAERQLAGFEPRACRIAKGRFHGASPQHSLGARRSYAAG